MERSGLLNWGGAQHPPWVRSFNPLTLPLFPCPQNPFADPSVQSGLHSGAAYVGADEDERSKSSYSLPQQQEQPDVAARMEELQRRERELQVRWTS